MAKNQKKIPDGRIVKSNAGLYDIFLDTTEKIIQAKSRGVLRHQNIQPLVGDLVLLEIQDGMMPVVTEIFPRKNQLVRPLITNIDVCLVVISVKEPNFQQYLLDKYLAILEYNDINPLIMFTKFDLLNDEEQNDMELISNYYESIGYPCFPVSAGIIDKKDELKRLLAGQTATVMGQTGVGKSTLLNDLSEQQWTLHTNEISQALGRGRHTTRIVELLQLEDFWIADTPGFSSFDVNDITSVGLTDTFVEFADYHCQFNNCVHINEHRCGVIKAVEEENILATRYENYCKIYQEIKTQEENKKW